MKNEVSVADLVVREGWDEHPPPPSRERWRVIAVMVAVVLGCGAAAVIVRSGATVNYSAPNTDQIGIIQMPERTSGVAGADATSVSVPTSGPDGAGHGAAPAVPDRSVEPTSTALSTSTTQVALTSPPTTTSASAPGTPSRADPTTTTSTSATTQLSSTSSSRLSPSPTTGTTPPKRCWLLIFC